MQEKVLLVDDEERVLEGYGRILKRHFDVLTANSGERALAVLDSESSVAVIVADMRMPNMDGIELLTQTRQRHPDVVRMMLTGNADQRTAVEAVNQGEIFRFLNKPCASDELTRAITAAVAHHRLLLAERELLESTLRGSVAALGEVLALVNPSAFGTAERLSALMCELADALELPDRWLYETLGRLSQVGCVVLPENLIEKVRTGARLNTEERHRFERHPAVGADLIGCIPRLEACAQGIRYQLRNFDGSGPPVDGPSGEAIPLAARLLRVALQCERQQSTLGSPLRALEAMRANRRCFDPRVLNALDTVVKQRQTGEQELRISLHALREGMVFAEDLRNTRGTLIVACGQDVTPTLRARLEAFTASGQLPESVAVIRTGTSGDTAARD